MMSYSGVILVDKNPQVIADIISILILYYFTSSEVSTRTKKN